MSTENKTKSQIAKEFLEQNPNATLEEISAASGMTAKTTKHWWYQQKRKDKPKKKVRRKVVKKQTTPKPQTDNPSGQVEYLEKVVLRLELELDALRDENQNLKYQAIGYDSVIDYLWTKLKEQ